VKKLKSGQYLPTIWTKVCGLLFWDTLYRHIGYPKISLRLESQTGGHWL